MSGKTAGGSQGLEAAELARGVLQSRQGRAPVSLSQPPAPTPRLTRGCGGTRPTNLESGAWGHPPLGCQRSLAVKGSEKKGGSTGLQPWGMDVVLGEERVEGGGVGAGRPRRGGGEEVQIEYVQGPLKLGEWWGQWKLVGSWWNA